MKLYFISNNLVLDNINYNYFCSIEDKRVNRPLSIEGEEVAKSLVGKNFSFKAIYSSSYASAISSAKYLSNDKDITINIENDLRDAVVGDIGKSNMQMLRYMQEKDFDYRYPNGEALNDTNRRMNMMVEKILRNKKDALIFTHRRAILAYLLDKCENGFNLDERLILTFNEKVILDDIENPIDIIEITYEDNEIKDINRIEIEA